MHATHDTGDEWLTVPEAAKRLRVNESTVRRWIYQGLLPGTERTSPGQGDYRIPLEAITQFEKNRKVS